MKYPFEFNFSFLNIAAMLVTGSMNVSSLRRKEQHSVKNVSSLEKVGLYVLNPNVQS